MQMASRSGGSLTLLVALSYAWVAAFSGPVFPNEEVYLLQTDFTVDGTLKRVAPQASAEDHVHLLQRDHTEVRKSLPDAEAGGTSSTVVDTIYRQFQSALARVKVWAHGNSKAANQEHMLLPGKIQTNAAVGTKWADISPGEHVAPDGDEGLAFFSSASPREWMLLGATCVGFFLVDYFVIQNGPSTFYYHACALALWLLLALAFNGFIAWQQGKEQAMMWTSGYLLEWMLSMDNLLVFHMIFKVYKTPPTHIHKAVFVGIFGAIFMRMVFFMVLSTMLHCMSWVRIPFGCLLLWSGVEAARSDDDEDYNVEDMRIVRGLRWLLGDRLVDRYSKTPELLLADAKQGFQVTLLFVVVVCLEASDIIFAMDSVSAKVAQIPDQYISFSSSIVAMFGLRALFFIIHDLVEMFDLLKYGLCLILVFIGSELIFGVSLPPASACLLIASVFVVSIIGSVTMKRIQTKNNSEPEVASN